MAVKILSGGYGSKESDYVYEVAEANRPAIRGLDMMEYSPSIGASTASTPVN